MFYYKFVIVIVSYMPIESFKKASVFHIFKNPIYIISVLQFITIEGSVECDGEELGLLCRSLAELLN